MEGMLDDVLRPIHGGTDEGPEPLYDFSTNANALGPNPVALAYLRRADSSRYPDPLYRRLRRALAEAHGEVRRVHANFSSAMNKTAAPAGKVYDAEADGV